MWRYDFHLFYLAGQAVLAGKSPYTIWDFNPPYPLAMLFALVAWMPEWLAYLLYLSGCLWLLWRVTGKRFIWAVLSFPVFFSLFVGQIDLPLALLASLLGPWGLPFLLTKPQVGLVVAPWIIRRTHWQHLAVVGLIGAAVVALSFLLRPTWLSEWLAATPSLTSYARRDSNIYWLIPSAAKSAAILIGVMIALPLGFMLRRRRQSWAVLQLFAPLTNIYSASVLSEWFGPLEVALSWLAILAVGDIHSGAPMFVIPLSILIRSGLYNLGRAGIPLKAEDALKSLSPARSDPAAPDPAPPHKQTK
jgi:hypothetical protein